MWGVALPGGVQPRPGCVQDLEEAARPNSALPKPKPEQDFQKTQVRATSG